VVAVSAAVIASKLLAGAIVGRLYRYTGEETLLMSSLTLPQVAALAAALVGFGTVDTPGERLVDRAMLSAVLVMMVVTSIVGPILTERYGTARRRTLERETGARTGGIPDLTSRVIVTAALDEHLWAEWRHWVGRAVVEVSERGLHLPAILQRKGNE
jgi:hypothetical protein